MSAIDAADWMVVRSLLKDGLTPAEIVDKTGLDLAGVDHIATTLKDTRDAAKELLHGHAHVFAERVVKDADVDQSLEVLDRLDVAPKKQQDVGRGGHVNIVIGMPGQAAGPDPFLGRARDDCGNLIVETVSVAPIAVAATDRSRLAELEAENADLQARLLKKERRRR
jgi:hypothetical protein